MRGVRISLGALLLVTACSEDARRPPEAGVIHLFDFFRSPAGLPVEPERRTIQGVGQEAVAHDLERELAAPVVVPVGAALRFALAVEGPPEGAEALVLLREHGRERELWSTDSLSHRWTFHRVDLTEYAGRAAEVVLRGRGGAQRRLLWGSPVISTSGRPRRDLVLYEIDTLRADVLDPYGTPDAWSPAIGALARQGVQFSECYSTSSWTRPAATSILTSRSPARHGVVGEKSRLPDSAVTLADVLRERGWYTVAVQTNPHAGRPAGLDQGFDLVLEMNALIPLYVPRYGERWKGVGLSTGSTSGTGELVAFALEQMLPEWNDLPLFLYLHTTDPHVPNTPRWPFLDLPGLEREGMRRRAAEIFWKYGQDVRAGDFFVGRTLRLLERAGRLDRTLFVLISDHGEEFGEHGRIGHGLNLYVETLRVPMIFWMSGRLPGPRLRRDRVSTLDVVPAVLDLLEVEAPAGIEGERLFPGPARNAGDPFPLRFQFAHVINKGIRMDEEAAADVSSIGHISAVRGPWKYVLADYGERRKPRSELYDLRVDPGETDDVAADYPDLVREMDREARAWWEEGRRGVVVEHQSLDPELEAQLRALGYLK